MMAPMRMGAACRSEPKANIDKPRNLAKSVTVE